MPPQNPLNNSEIIMNFNLLHHLGKTNEIVKNDDKNKKRLLNTSKII